MHTIVKFCLDHLKQLTSRCSKNKNKTKNNKMNGKYWSSYVQWRNLLLLTPYSVDKIVGSRHV